MKKIAYTKVFRKLVKLAIIVVLAITIFFALLTAKLIIVNHTCSSNPMFTNGNLEITMIDVGNGDSFLILQNNKAMLVDTGYVYTYSNIKEILHEKKVQKLDYVILTHPHWDHEGGFLRLLFDFHIDNLIIQHNLGNYKMTRDETLFYNLSQTIINYENFFNNNLIETPENLTFSQSTINFFNTRANNTNYDALNNYTLVFKLQYQNNSILFTGDLQSEGESMLLDTDVDLHADILKIGHHGSKTSSSKEFLTAVSPKYAIISCHNGENNSYGHPVKSLMEFLSNRNIPLYRTDELGNVTLSIDGKNIVFDKEPGNYLSGPEFLAQNTK